MRLVYERRIGEFYLCIPEPLVRREENQAPNPKRIVALDPGVRTFMTTYDPSGVAMEVGAGDIDRIYWRCFLLDDLQSRISKYAKERKYTYQTRRRMRKVATRMRRRIRNQVNEVHCKLAKHLCETYDVILIPPFETQKMVRKRQPQHHNVNNNSTKLAYSYRKINSKTARGMMTWAHYRFRMHLLNKAREYPWCSVVIVNEAYTSKTCGRCGEINNKLGSSKTFICPNSKCKLKADRDVHAARNILLRHLTEYTQ